MPHATVLHHFSLNTDPAVHLPDGATLTANAQGHLPCTTNLPSSATLAHVFTGLHTTSIISLGQFCDHSCKVVLDKNNGFVVKDNQIIITGMRNTTDGLWDIPISQHTPIPTQIPSSQRIHHMNVILTKEKTRKELVDCLHACCFSPTKQTFLQAIKNGNFITWPGLTPDLVSKHLIPSLATAKGHLAQERKKCNQPKQHKKITNFFQLRKHHHLQELTMSWPF